MSDNAKWLRHFKICATKDVYLGQGVSYNKGESHQETFTRVEAEYIAALLNANSWNPNCWEVCENINE